MFALGRNHPLVRERSKKCSTAIFPISSRWMCRRLPDLGRALLRHVPYLEKVFFANSGAESVEAAIKFARAATGRPGIVYCGHAFPWPDLRRAVAHRRRDFPRRLRAFVAGLRRGTLQRSCCAGKGARLAKGRGLHRRADSRQGREHAGRRTICVPRSSCVANTEPCSSPMRCRPGWANRAFPRLRALGRRARHGAASKVIVRRPCPGRRRADPQMDIRQGVRPNGPRGRARVDLLQKRSGDGGRDRHARDDGIRRTDRERGANR